MLYSEQTRQVGHALIAALMCLPQLATAHPNLGEFDQTAFLEQPETVDCTLTDGTAASCYKIIVSYLPEGLEIGPFCPATLEDDGGIWDWTGENAKLYRIDEAFLRMLEGLGYKFFDDDGTVHVVDNATQQPTVDHACINVAEAKDVTITMLLPVNPVMANEPVQLNTVNKVGVALDGVPIFSDAPSIQQTGHMPALDTCGGHIDPGGWYHWHATASDIETTYDTADVAADCALTQDSRALFGYAFDGFAMFGSTEADGSVPENLDSCNGHVGDTVLGRVYHYHASTVFPNLPPCLVGLQAEDNFTTTASAGVGAPRPEGAGGPGGQPQGLEDAAEQLGVTPKALMDALHTSGSGQPDLAAAAKTLGIAQDTLEELLPPPPPR